VRYLVVFPRGLSFQGGGIGIDANQVTDELAFTLQALEDANIHSILVRPVYRVMVCVIV
jgi:hypothetical protein